MAWWLSNIACFAEKPTSSLTEACVLYGASNTVVVNKAVVNSMGMRKACIVEACCCCLQLPNYRRASTMRQKLLQSISSGAGFELS